MNVPKIEFWDDFVSTIGAFSCCEALALYDVVSQAKSGFFIELGSHKGRSSICIAAALPDRSVLCLIEPEFKDSKWLTEVVERVNKWVSSENSLIGCAAYSLETIPFVHWVSFCFIDSGVHDDMVTEECKLLEDRMVSGGIIAMHDFKNQFTAVQRAYDYLLSTGKYEEIKIDWDFIFDYVKQNNLKDGELSWHVYPDLPHPPNFLGALRRK